MGDPNLLKRLLKNLIFNNLLGLRGRVIGDVIRKAIRMTMDHERILDYDGRT